MMKRLNLSKAAIAFFLIGLGVGLDQLTKSWALERLPNAPMTVIPKALSFVYAENRNMAFGLGQVLPISADAKRWLLIALTSLLTAFLIVMMVRSADFASRLGFGITAAGAIGNIIDRVRIGYVVDFIYWHGGFTWPNFNVADILVCTGVGVLLVFGGREAKKPPTTAAT
jgi:signal peptidase II